jgi:hypothetical protein
MVRGQTEVLSLTFALFLIVLLIMANRPYMGIHCEVKSKTVFEYHVPKGLVIRKEGVSVKKVDSTDTMKVTIPPPTEKSTISKLKRTPTPSIPKMPSALHPPNIFPRLRMPDSLLLRHRHLLGQDITEAPCALL